MARYGTQSKDVERLLSDMRVLGPSGIERIAWAWQRYTGPQLADVDQAEKVARQAIAEDGLEDVWKAAEADIKALTEGHFAQEAWRAESESIDRSAEDAMLHAALALVAKPFISVDVYRILAKTGSEALPWLLPNERPDQYREPHV